MTLGRMTLCMDNVMPVIYLKYLSAECHSSKCHSTKRHGAKRIYIIVGASPSLLDPLVNGNYNLTSNVYKPVTYWNAKFFSQDWNDQKREEEKETKPI